MHGNRIARKHLGWIIERKTEEEFLSAEEAAAWRRRLTAETDNAKVAEGGRELYARLADCERRAA